MSDEGGFVDNPEDTGGATNFGVSLKYARKSGHEYLDKDGDGVITKDDIKNLTREDAERAFREDFWIGGFEPRVSKGVSNLAFNMGKPQATKILQRAANDLGANLKIDGISGPNTEEAVNRLDPDALTEAVKTRAKVFYRNLAKKPGQKQFLEGWLNRVDRL